MNRVKYTGCLVLLVGILVACGNRDKGDGVRLPRMKEEVLIERLDRLSSTSVEFFYSKIKTKYKDSAQSVSFKTSLRILEDSAVNLLITYARFPVVNAVISKDSMKITNKRENCYILEEVDYIKQQFGVDFTHRNIEELFLGLPVGFQSGAKYHRTKDVTNYTLCSHSKRELDDLKQGELVFYYTLTEDAEFLKSTVIESPSDSTVIRIECKEREAISGHTFPMKMIVIVQRKDQEICAEMEYTKTRIDNNDGIHFVIPESYEACE